MFILFYNFKKILTYKLNGIDYTLKNTAFIKYIFYLYPTLLPSKSEAFWPPAADCCAPVSVLLLVASLSSSC